MTPSQSNIQIFRSFLKMVAVGMTHRDPQTRNHNMVQTPKRILSADNKGYNKICDPKLN